MMSPCKSTKCKGHNPCLKCAAELCGALIRGSESAHLTVWQTTTLLDSIALAYANTPSEKRGEKALAQSRRAGKKKK
jgi:hypothetical protein